MKCYYHNDLDGRCAGAIVYNFIDPLLRKAENLEMIEIDYKDKLDIETITKEEQLYIVDFSFTPEVMKKILQKTKNIVWIDHHKTAKDYDYGIVLKGLRNFEDKKYSGCELTWKFFYPDTPMPMAVKLIGDRDKWAWKLKNTKEFNQGIKLHNTKPNSSLWLNIFNDKNPLIPAIIAGGNICIEFRDSFCKDYADSYGFETEFEGYKCFALGLYMFGSEAFGERFKQYDICLSYEFLGNNWVVGLYSKTVDVSVIAKKYEGGGHIGAAGFVSKDLPFKKIK